MAAGEDSEIFDNEQSIDVTFELNEIRIRHHKHVFICSYHQLFDIGLIEHDFKSNEKAIELLKAGQLAFSHHENEKKLFLKYRVQGLDLSITIGIPHKLFDLDVESCDEKEQLNYYKHKAMKLEKIIRMNHMTLKKYTVSEFNAKSVYTGLSVDEIKQHCKIYKDTLHSVYKRISKCSTTYNEECKRQSVMCVPRDWEYVLEDDEDYVYVDLSEANKPSVEVRKYENEITLNIRRLFLNHRVISLKRNKQDQRLLDEVSQDMVIGVFAGYDSMQTLETDPLILYLAFRHEKKLNYAVNNFYKFVLQSDGTLVLKYLYSAECVAVRTEDSNACQYAVKKLPSKPCIAWIDRSKQHKAYYCEISCCSKIKQFQWCHKTLSGNWTLFQTCN